MDAKKLKVVKDVSPMLKIYEDGSVERLLGTHTVPPSLEDPVPSKDVLYSPLSNLSCRLYRPKTIDPARRLPLLVYYHGGGFCIESAFSPTYHTYLCDLVSEASVIVVSVDYRRAPEDPLPVAYDDSWTALTWATSHGSDEWLNLHADFSKVFLAGDSAGANIVHYVAMRFGREKLPGVSVAGIVLVHPYFWGEQPVGDEVHHPEWKSKIELFWRTVHPTTSGLDDPLMNPACDPDLAKLGCSRVLILVAEKDILRSRGWYYHHTLKNSGWNGTLEIMESKDEDHVFHLFKPACENAAALLTKISSFLNQAS